MEVLVNRKIIIVCCTLSPKNTLQSSVLMNVKLRQVIFWSLISQGSIHIAFLDRRKKLDPAVIFFINLHILHYTYRILTLKSLQFTIQY